MDLLLRRARRPMLGIFLSATLIAAGAVQVLAQDASPSPMGTVDAVALPSGDTESMAEATATVDIVDFTFPADIVIEVGSSIRWQNIDPISHTVTATDTSFDSGRIEPGTAFEQTFAEPGVIAYSCLFHPAMTGTITVVEGDADPALSPDASDAASPDPEMSTLDE
jgi:plastocyanin